MYAVSFCFKSSSSRLYRSPLCFFGGIEYIEKESAQIQSFASWTNLELGLTNPYWRVHFDHWNHLLNLWPKIRRENLCPRNLCPRKCRFLSDLCKTSSNFQDKIMSLKILKLTIGSVNNSISTISFTNYTSKSQFMLSFRIFFTLGTNGLSRPRNDWGATHHNVLRSGIRSRFWRRFTSLLSRSLGKYRKLTH